MKISANLKKQWPYLAIGGGVFILVLLSYLAGLFTGPEFFLEDRLLSPRPVSPEIVILSIDDSSIAEEGQWPWPRRVFAVAFEKLKEAKPKAVALDVIFSEPSRLGPADDASLAGELKGVSFPVIFPLEGRDLTIGGGGVYASGTIKPLALFTDTSKVSLGHVNLFIDRDGIVRRVPLSIIKEGEEAVRAFSWEVLGRNDFAEVKEYYGEDPRIVYAAPPGGIRQISFTRLLHDPGVLATLKDKIVFIGATAPDLHDEKPTPLGEGTEMPGVEIQANIANMFISGARLAPVGGFGQAIVFLVLSIIPAILFILAKSAWRALLFAVFLGVLSNVAIFLAFDRGLIINIFHANLSWILSTVAVFSYRYLLAEKGKKELREIFGKYVSSAVLETILANPEKVSLGGEERTVTVLFSDIRGFTTLSEKTTPPELVSILNRYFTLMTGEVLKHGGVLDKYIGDAVMAFWGAPLPDEHQADNAVRASMGMIERLKEFNTGLKKEKGIDIDIGIGLFTGPAVVGNIGSAQRFDYTVMGDTVNVASRLEGLNKEYKTNLIVGETTKSRVSLPITFKKIGSTTVKGRSEPITIYTV